MPKKILSSEVFYWDAPSRSLHKRDLFPLQVNIGGHLYHVPKWNLNDFKAVEFPHAIDSNEPFIVELIIRFRNFKIQFETEASQINYNSEKKELTAHFEGIPEEHKELLRYFSEALETGDMVNIDNVLRRVDMPVSPANTQIVASENNKSFFLKRLFFSSAYILLGLGLIAFSLASLQRKLTEVEVESAFISIPLVSIQSPYQGSVDEVFITEGNTVEVNQPLISLKPSTMNSPLTTQNNESQQLLIKAELDKKSNSLGSLDIYKRKIAAASAALSAALSAQQIKCNARYESAIDKRSPLKRNAQCNAANDKVTSAKIKVSLEKEQFKVAQQKYSRNRNTAKTLSNKLKLLQQANQATELLPIDSEHKNTVKSHVSGHVVSVLDENLQYLNRGKTIALIQPKDSQEIIEAYITQKQALELKVGDKAHISSVTFDNKTVPAVIDKIEYTINVFKPSNKELLHWNVPKENTVKLSLKFINKHSATLPMGLPVTVTIKKDADGKNVLWEKVTSFFKSNKRDSSLTKVGDKSVGDNDNIFGLAYADDVNKTPSVPTYCKSKLRLFPKTAIKSLKGSSENIKIYDLNWKQQLVQRADKNLDIKSSALKSLASSGITDANNADLKITRKSLRDANTSVILSFAFLITNKTAYLKKSKELLLDWANTYKSNGHPINETRLEGFLWSYDLLRCYFSLDEQRVINKWLKQIQVAKHAWVFGPSSFQNNLHTHQLKMLLMLDKLLDDKVALKSDRETLQIHQINNLMEDGSSFDYKERDALHYHVYNLEPWLEIALLEPQYKDTVNKAYDFLMTQLNSGNIHDQFVNSRQGIDEKRAKGGFEYAKKGGSFEPEKITRSAIVHSTLNQLSLDLKNEEKYISKKQVMNNLIFVVRDLIWQP